MKISPKNWILAYRQIQRFILKSWKIWKLSNISVFLTHQFTHLLYDMGIKEAEENFLFRL